MGKRLIVTVVCWCLLLVLCAPVAAQFRLTAVPSKTVVEPDEVFQIQFVVEGGMQVDEFVPPAFRQLQQLGAMVKTNGWTWVNGSLTEYSSFTFQLKASKPGKIYLASAIAKVKGRILTSSPFAIVVADNNLKLQQPQDQRSAIADYVLAPGENAGEKIRNNLFVQLQVDKQQCYVGEAVIASFKLYSRLESESKIVKRPSFNGFSVTDLEAPEAGQFTKELVNGKMYNAYLIRKVRLYPLQEGTLAIEPVEIENKVRLLRLNQQPGGKSADLEALLRQMEQQELRNEQLVEETVTISTQPQTISVLPIPDTARPTGFSGAVGMFSIELLPVSQPLYANDAAVLQVKVKGKGNLDIVTAPQVQWPAGVEPLEPRSVQLIRETEDASGELLFEYPFNAPAGTYVIPPISLSFFDPALRQFITAATDSTVVEVLPAVVAVSKGMEETKELPMNQYLSFGWYAAAVVAVLLLVLMLWWLGNRKKRSRIKTVVPVAAPEPEIDDAQFYRKPVGVYLQEVAQQGSAMEPAALNRLLQEAVLTCLAERLGLRYKQPSVTAVTEVMKTKGQQALAEEVLRWIRQSEAQLYLPFTVEADKDQLLAGARNLLEKADGILG